MKTITSAVADAQKYMSPMFCGSLRQRPKVVKSIADLSPLSVKPDDSEQVWQRSADTINFASALSLKRFAWIQPWLVGVAAKEHLSQF